MKGKLSHSQIGYVLFHLGHHVELTADISSRFNFGDPSNERSGQITFSLSDKPLDITAVRMIGKTPMLFPLGDKADSYRFDDKDNLVFLHDVLKTVFYLLSGYQEYINQNSKDNLGRFAFEDSIQSKLNMAGVPVVNYYFETIVEALEEFGRRNNVVVKRRRLFSNYGFFLSHDIDYVDLYTKNYIIYKAKEILKLRPSRLSVGRNLGLLFEGMKKYVVGRNNPYWNFDFLRQLERQHGFRSVFFFLDQGILHSDAYYSFSEDRFRQLFNFLKDEQCEIGIHGPVRSVTSLQHMKESLGKLQTASQSKVIGARQHRLLWRHPLTASIQQQAGLQYDTTLGFAAHEGFRNSYCHPFRLYDFENDKMMHLWEFPMNAMDVTLFSYRNLKPDEAFAACSNLVSEIKKFGGVFNLLWHNSFFDEVTYPGITDFYKEILGYVERTGGENVLGQELVERIEKLNQ